jgi:hypothetical protein
VLAAVNPLPCRIDLAVRLDRSDHGCSRDLDLTRFLDDALQRSAQITPSFVKEPESMGVTIDAGSVCKSVLLGQGGRAAPSYKLRFDLRTMRAKPKQ